MSAADRNIREQGRLWGSAWIDRAILPLVGVMAAGALSEAQEDRLVSSFNAAVLERCAELVRSGLPNEAVQAFAQAAMFGADGRCKELAAQALAANDH